MRTLALLAMTGIIAAAEEPKPTPAPAPLKTAERMALTDLYAKRAELDKAISAILAEACADRQLNAQRCRLQPDGTFMELPERKAPEVKK